jgi:hypothetical protein
VLLGDQIGLGHVPDGLDVYTDLPVAGHREQSHVPGVRQAELQRPQASRQPGLSVSVVRITNRRRVYPEAARQQDPQRCVGDDEAPTVTRVPEASAAGTLTRVENGVVVLRRLPVEAHEGVEDLGGADVHAIEAPKAADRPYGRLHGSRRGYDLHFISEASVPRSVSSPAAQASTIEPSPDVLRCGCAFVSLAPKNVPAAPRGCDT